MKTLLRRTGRYIGQVADSAGFEVRPKPQDEPPARERFPIQFWYEGNLWEPTVQWALRDLCRPGQVVYDVGVNAGGITQIISRLVGPRGVVCGFEASPRIIDKAQHNLAVNGCFNVQLFHRAVFSTSGERVKIYYGSHLNDSIVTPGTGEYALVETVALDDFASFTGLWPSVIKCDIEGAEFDALKGMHRILADHKPHLILEQSPSDGRCLELLAGHGYFATDLNCLKYIQTIADYPPSSVRNVLFTHRDRAGEHPYSHPISLEPVASLKPEDFVVLADGSWRQRTPMPVPPGRYFIDCEFDASGTDNEMMAGVLVDGVECFRYHTYTKFLRDSYRDWVLPVRRAASIGLFFDFKNYTSDSTFQIRQIGISRAPGFGRFEGFRIE